VLRQRQQAQALLAEQVADGAAVGVAGRAPDVRDLGDPARELGIEVLDRREPPRREERVAQIPDLALDLALLVRARL
jgi:hypothetical protein